MYLKHFIIFIGLIASLNSLGQAGMDAQRLKRLDAYLQRCVDSSQIPGSVTMVWRDNVQVYHKAFGFANTIDRTPMNTDALFFIQSMTKPVITSALMMLYEEGHFLLTDPVHKYIPAFKNLKVAKDPTKGKDGETEPLKKDITIAHLLSHTAGLSHGLGSTELDKEYARTMYFQRHTTVQDRVNAMLTLPLLSQPGDKWYYSAAPDVLSVLIEQFSGMNTNDFLKKRIFDPLGMKNTFYNVPEVLQKNVVKVHYKNAQGKLMVSPQQPAMAGNTLWSGVNALYATASDYMLFCRLLLNKGELNGNRLLSRKTVELMTINHTKDLFDGPGEGFGLGFAVVDDVAGTGLLGSNGIFYWSGANNTHFFIDPSERLIGIFMTQLAPYDGVYHQKLRQHVLQAIVD
jgi:CubicO group peptidase (beta-lactamase class C family)